MSKPNRKTTAGINIQAKEVNVGGDIVGGNKTVKHILQPNDSAEANRIAGNILSLISNLESIENEQKEELLRRMEDIRSEISKNAAAAPLTITSKLMNFKELLTSIQGIGNTGFGIYTLVENLLRLLPK